MSRLYHAFPSLLLLSAFLVSAACGGGPVDPADPASVLESAPAAMGKADSQDAADRECKVILRSVAREPSGDDFEVDCASGGCLYVWRGLVDVAAEVPSDVTVKVQYHLTSTSKWWEVEAQPAAASPAGYRRYSFAMSGHLFGPESGGADGQVIELVAFVRYPGGARLFDHNRFPGDFENHLLTAEQGFGSTDGGACAPVAGAVYFRDDWQELESGERRQGGYLEVHYDLDRLPDCRGTHNGHPAWDTVAYALFLPGGQVLSGSVRSFVSDYGQPTTEAVEVPFVTEIPEDATKVELWFRNYSGAGSSCEAWDSNFGKNYRFDVLPAKDDPKCLDVERETGANTEDPRMVHMAPYCLPYSLDAQYDANHCELYVDGVGKGHMGHYGMPINWVVAYLHMGPAQGELLNAGIYTQYHDKASGAGGVRFSLGMEVSPGVFKTGFAYFVTGFQSVQPVDVSVDAFAFFADVKRTDGKTVRLWQSAGGKNYTWNDAFGMATTKEYIPYGNIEWANAGAPVYASRAACGAK